MARKGNFGGYANAANQGAAVPPRSTSTGRQHGLKTVALPTLYGDDGRPKSVKASGNGNLPSGKSVKGVYGANGQA